MAFFPISHTGVQYVNTNGDPFSGAVLKAFAAGTTNNILMATDSSGDTTASSMALNSDGYPEVSSTVVIPHINETYKLSLFPTQAAADSNTGAIWTQDNLSISSEFGSFTQEISTSTVLDSTDNNSHINASGTITITLPDIDAVGAGYLFSIRNSGSGVVTLDGDGTETINDDLTYAIAAGAGGFVISGDTNWSAIGLKDAQIDKINTFTKTQTWSKGADVASATALPVLTDGNSFDVTGTTTVTSIDTLGIGTVIKLHFDDVLILTHNATDLILPTGANITTAAGDEAEFTEYASGDWRCTNYSRASGLPLKVITSETAQATTSGTAFDFNVPSGTKKITVSVVGVSLSGTDQLSVQIGDAGGIETSGYESVSSRLSGSITTNSSTSAFIMNFAAAAVVAHGEMVLSLADDSTNTWTAHHGAGRSDSSVSIVGGGSKSLSAEATQVRITRSGTNTFDAGKVNIQFEG